MKQKQIILIAVCLLLSNQTFVVFKTVTNNVYALMCAYLMITRPPGMEYQSTPNQYTHSNNDNTKTIRPAASSKSHKKCQNGKQFHQSDRPHSQRGL